ACAASALLGRAGRTAGRRPPPRTGGVSLALTEAGPEAAALLAALHEAGIGAAGPAWDEAAFASLLSQPGRLALIASAGAEPVGLLLLGLAADEAEVLTLAVVPAARRGGVGRALLGRAADVAAGRGARRMFLEVAERNAAGRALYAAAGFSEIARRRAYYAHASGRQDALVLARALSPSS
ncbi:GNAT family N-acetyltransferase, partial [Elioraea rosea]|uniref:GNAT family N-acetyltransferase n=1 Tax=Elioraea rosea TaxID=2492390 RepID=UPI001EF4D445